MKTRVALSPLLLAISLAGRGDVVHGQQRTEQPGVITGILHDSLLRGGPVSGADVVLTGTGRSARTDSLGRFRFDDVAPGTWRVAFTALWLDSVAVAPLAGVVEVVAGERAAVALSTPSPDTWQSAVCGRPLSAGLGAMLGDVADAGGRPAADVRVRARWRELTVGPGIRRWEDLATSDTTDATGVFVLCGVPLDATFELRAGDDTLGSDELLVPAAGEVVRRMDLVIGPADRTFTLRGSIVGDSGQAIAGASVRLSREPERGVFADGAGSFSLDGVPARSTALTIRAIGFAPRRVAVDPRRPDDTLRVALDRIPVELMEVEVTERPFAALAAAFEERRRYYTGTFLDSADLSRLPVITPAAVAERVPRARGAGSSIVLARGPGWCSPRLFVDGGEIPRPLPGGALKEWLQRAKRIEVYRAAFAPARFADFDGCGAIVIWTN